jgi:nucleoside-diphosphate-sugar epimerase
MFIHQFYQLRPLNLSVPAKALSRFVSPSYSGLNCKFASDTYKDYNDLAKGYIMGKRKAFVTGGTGFVGINLIRELVKQDWDVTALHRPSSDLSYIQNLGVSFVEGSILDPNSLVTGMPDGVDTVFHVAGNTSQWKAQNDEQTLDNVDGTRNVVDAAVTKKARRLIVTSSVAAYGLHTGEFK